MEKYRIALTFIEPLLGTVPKNQKIYEEYIAPQAELSDEDLADELESIEEASEKGWTGFHLLDGQHPYLYDYQLKGFFKDACGMLRRDKKSQSAKLQAYKKIIDGLMFVKPRQIPLNLNGHQMDTLKRPLRAQTAQGERVSLAKSDTCPAGTTLKFMLLIRAGVSRKLLVEWLDYGEFRGLGQWRNAGYGSFTYEIEAVA